MQGGFIYVDDMATIEKTDQETLDYGISYVRDLQPGETITGSTWSVAGLTKGVDGVNGDAAIVWLSGGVAGTVATVDNVVQTSEGRVFERGFNVRVIARKSA